MIKSEFLTKLAEKEGIGTKKHAGEALDAVLATIKEVMVAGDEISFVGFGKFSVTERAEREARNPKDGSTIVVPAHKVPKFKAGSGLKEAVR